MRGFFTRVFVFFFFNDTATTEIYTLSLHDALPIWAGRRRRGQQAGAGSLLVRPRERHRHRCKRDRKSTRLNSSHSQISYAVFCLKKKKNLPPHTRQPDSSHSSIHSARPLRNTRPAL